MSCAVAMLIPQGVILRPLLSVIGFGPYGPIRGGEPIVTSLNKSLIRRFPRDCRGLESTRVLGSCRTEGRVIRTLAERGHDGNRSRSHRGGYRGRDWRHGRIRL